MGSISSSGTDRAPLLMISSGSRAVETARLAHCHIALVAVLLLLLLLRLLTMLLLIGGDAVSSVLAFNVSQALDEAVGGLSRTDRSATADPTQDLYSYDGYASA